jgi:hypothetical protein
MRPRLTVRLLEKTGPPTQVGTVDFFRIPVENPEDFKGTPRGVLSIKQARHIAEEWQRGRTFGEVGDLEWQEYG